MKAAGLRLDDRDMRILEILQTEGRIAKTALAQRVNLSPTPCWERLKRLEAAGIIEGYGARISLKAFAPLSVVFMEAELESHTAADFARFEHAIQVIPEVVECWAVGGGIDYLMKIVTRDITAYQALVDRLLASAIGLKRYYTYVVTKPAKQAPMPPLKVVCGAGRPEDSSA